MPALRPTPLTLSVALAVALVLALTEAAQVWLGLSLLGSPVPWTVAFRATGPSWVVFLLAVLPVLRILDAFAARRVGPAGTIARHAPIAVAFTLAHLAGTAWVGELLAPEPVGLGPRLTRLATVYFVPDLLTYAAIVGVHHALRRYAEDRRREVEAARLVAEVAEARMLAVRGRLRADFFFNTLNAVAGLLVRGDSARGVDALSSLSALLRSSLLTDPSDRIPLEDEVELVGGYLSIQELRFPGRVRGSITVEDGAGGARIPPLLLVQIVEAVVDGGLERGAPFGVDVRVRSGNGGVLARVTHDGPAAAGAEAARGARARLARLAWGSPADVDVHAGAVEVTLPTPTADSAGRPLEVAP